MDPKQEPNTGAGNVGAVERVQNLRRSGAAGPQDHGERRVKTRLAARNKAIRQSDDED
jgi:hypothetical protein